MVLAEKPVASGPRSIFSAEPISPVEIPFKYSHGSAASMAFAFRT